MQAVKSSRRGTDGASEGRLNAALRLLVEEGDALTMTAVARRASCSKETLYKWFGDRDGLLTATVQWQASKVRVAPVDRAQLDLPVAEGKPGAVCLELAERDFQSRPR